MEFSTDSFLFSCFFLFFLVLRRLQPSKHKGCRANKWRDLRFQVERFTVIPTDTSGIVYFNLHSCYRWKCFVVTSFEMDDLWDIIWRK